MEKRIKLLDEVVIAAPCPVTWESMTGDDRVRHCCGCSRNVYNISDMSSNEAEDFLAEHGATQCLQIYRRPDGKVMTDNCPRALRPLRNKCRTALRVVFGLAASVLAFIPLPRASAQDPGKAGDVYIPPVAKGKTIQSTNKSGGTCKKVFIGGEECNAQNGATQSTPQPQLLRGEPVAAPLPPGQALLKPIKGNVVPTPVPADKPGQAPVLGFSHTPTVQAPEKPGNKANIGDKPDLRDSKALNMFNNAQRNEAEGKDMLAQTQYLEALKMAKAQKDGDAKFRQLIQQSCNKLRSKLQMPPVDLDGAETKPRK
jgi:hypothetical protein